MGKGDTMTIALGTMWSVPHSADLREGGSDEGRPGREVEARIAFHNSALAI